MAIPVLGEIERLITEHGSAAILKERVAQLREQIDILEKKALSLEKQNLALDGENEKLKAERDTLQLQVVNLRQEIQRRDDIVQKEKSHGVRLEEVKEKILMAVEKNQGATNQQIAQAAGVSKTVATFHLEELKKTKMVRDSEPRHCGAHRGSAADCGLAAVRYSSLAHAERPCIAIRPREPLN